MSDLTREDVKRLSKLCKIAVSEEEADHLLTDLQKILKFVDELQEVDTDDVPPCRTVLENYYNVFRSDEVSDPMPRDLFLSNAPSQIGGMIRVPTVIKGKVKDAP